jgi:hypothetical protein
MEEYVSLQKIINLFKNYVNEDPRLHSFGFGDVVNFGYSLEFTGATYGFMFVTPVNIIYETNITRYQLSIIFADKLNDDLSNQIQVTSDMSLVARRFLSQIYINAGTLFPYMNLVLPTQSIPFLERFNDLVAGVAINLEIEVFEDMNACAYFTPEEYYILYEAGEIMTTENDEGVEYEH